MMRITILEDDDEQVTITVAPSGIEADDSIQAIFDKNDELVQRLYDAVDAFWNE